MDGWEPTMPDPSTEPAPARRRTDRRDPRLALADQFGPAIAEQLWESLPPECRRETFDKKTPPDQYRPFVRAESAGGPWTTVALNMTGLPRTITFEAGAVVPVARLVAALHEPAAHDHPGAPCSRFRRRVRPAPATPCSAGTAPRPASIPPTAGRRCGGSMRR
jgi:hypothetical protein